MAGALDFFFPQKAGSVHFHDQYKGNIGILSATKGVLIPFSQCLLSSEFHPVQLLIDFYHGPLVFTAVSLQQGCLENSRRRIEYWKGQLHFPGNLKSRYNILVGFFKRIALRKLVLQDPGNKKIRCKTSAGP